MEYTFEMGDFVTNLMYYATIMFNSLIPVGAIIAGLGFGIGLVTLVIKLIKTSMGGF